MPRSIAGESSASSGGQAFQLGQLCLVEIGGGRAGVVDRPFDLVLDQAAELERALEAARLALDDRSFAAAWASGSALPAEQLLGLATERLQRGQTASSVGVG